MEALSRVDLKKLKVSRAESRPAGVETSLRAPTATFPLAMRQMNSKNVLGIAQRLKMTRVVA